MRQTLTHSAQLRQIIVARRRALKLSQRDLAAKLAISQNRLSEIETGRAPITFERLVDLFKVLGLDLVVQDRQPASKADW
jgi:HTH-type transcriptional regulator/antitoxin HipB